MLKRLVKAFLRQRSEGRGAFSSRSFESKGNGLIDGPRRACIQFGSLLQRSDGLSCLCSKLYGTTSRRPRHLAAAQPGARGFAASTGPVLETVNEQLTRTLQKALQSHFPLTNDHQVDRCPCDDRWSH